MNFINEFKKELKKNKIGLALILNSTLQDPNFYYFSNINPEAALLLISPKISTKIYCSPLEGLQLKLKSKIKSFYEFDKKTFEK